MKKVLITGADGQLGKSFVNNIKNKQLQLILTDYKTLDITNKDNLLKYLKKVKPDYILNFAAYTAVDLAEVEEDKAILINQIGVKNICEGAKLNNSFIIHISTDFIFDGKKNTPYTEEDTPNPLSVYGKTKLSSEKIILKNYPNKSLIIRTSWLYSEYQNNFFKTITKLGNEKKELGVISEQIGTPTYAFDLCKIIEQILTKKEPLKGIFHFSNEGVASWYDFAFEILQNQNISCQLKPLKINEYKTKATRPIFSILDKSKIKKELKIDFPHWKTSLLKCIKGYNNENH